MVSSSHADDTRSDDLTAAVMTKPEAERYDTQRQHDNQHLRVQMTFRKLRKKWQACHQQRQRQAMNEAQGRQANGRAVEPVGRLRHTLIHGELPLS